MEPVSIGEKSVKYYMTEVSYRERKVNKVWNIAQYIYVGESTSHFHPMND